EPTNHLDMITRDALKRAIGDFPGSAIIISHDPDFLKGICDRTFELSDGKLKNLNCSFNDYLLFHKEGVYGDSISVKKEKKAESKSVGTTDKNRSKKIQKEISEIENKLTLLEKNKVRFEELLSDSSFYKNRSYHTELDNYNDTKKNISELSKKWEELSEEMELIGRKNE
ncbi:MAG: ABC transporter ATP-binding protein, partial [Leptospira sp.]|nr:ABC transporter ATP-binding protein [Leptospira sp.]